MQTSKPRVLVCLSVSVGNASAYKCAACDWAASVAHEAGRDPVEVALKLFDAHKCEDFPLKQTGSQRKDAS